VNPRFKFDQICRYIAYGVKIELLKISVNGGYAKTVQIPPKKGKKARA
jgi:hypothetical protein